MRAFLPGGLLALAAAGPVLGAHFVRGDADGSGTVNVTDPIVLLGDLFLGGAAVGCPDAADVDDDGKLRVTDPIYLLNHLYLAGPSPPPPFPDPGPDSTPDGLSCAPCVPDLKELSDYLAQPAVQEILTKVPRHEGPSPMDARGRFDIAGTVEASTIPGLRAGAGMEWRFHFGARGGGQVQVTFLEPAYTDAGAPAFIEGAGERFTAYSVERSARLGLLGRECDAYLALVLSGSREPTIAAGALFDPFYRVIAPAEFDRVPKPDARDLAPTREARNPTGVVGAWLSLDGRYPGHDRTGWGDVPIAEWPRSLSRRIHPRLIALAGEDRRFDTADDRVLISGGGRDPLDFGGEPSEPSAEVVLIPRIP